MSTLKEELNRLSSINDIHEMLLEGVACTDVARYIQKTLRRLEHFEYSSIVEELKKRRRDLKNNKTGVEVYEKLGRGDELPGPPKSPQFFARKLYDRLALSVDPLIEVDSLYLATRDIIKAKIEDDPLDPSIQIDVDRARKLLETHMSIMEKMGLLNEGKQDNSHIDVSGVRKDFGSETAEVIEDPQSRHKVLEVIRLIRGGGMLPPHDHEAN